MFFSLDINLFIPKTLYLFAAHRTHFNKYTDIYLQMGQKVDIMLAATSPVKIVILVIALIYLSVYWRLNWNRKVYFIYFVSSSSYIFYQLYRFSKYHRCWLFKPLTKCGYNIHFCWVPGHMDIPGNESANKAAKSALNYYFIRNLLHILKILSKVLFIINGKKFEILKTITRCIILNTE